jgi:hypothetical protein
MSWNLKASKLNFLLLFHAKIWSAHYQNCSEIVKTLTEPWHKVLKEGLVMKKEDKFEAQEQACQNSSRSLSSIFPPRFVAALQNRGCCIGRGAQPDTPDWEKVAINKHRRWSEINWVSAGRASERRELWWRRRTISPPLIIPGVHMQMSSLGSACAISSISCATTMTAASRYLGG